MIKRIKILLLLLMFIASFKSYATDLPKKQPFEISLKGIWKFQTDPLDKGISEKWYTRSLSETIQLPASMTERGMGDDVTLQTKWTGSLYDSSWYFNPRMAKYRNQKIPKFPFFLTPIKAYIGAAWYQKEITIPQNWKGKTIQLYLERPHWETIVYLDDKKIGLLNSLSTPHQYTLPKDITPGKHVITIRVDNRIKEINPGQDSHSVTDQTQGNWNGIVGQIKLTAVPNSYIDDIRLYPNLVSKTVKVQLRIKNHEGTIGTGTLLLKAEPVNNKNASAFRQITVPFNYNVADTLIETTYAMGDHVGLWDELNPVCYNMKVTLSNQKGETDQKAILFGMRDFKTKGTRFEINGKEIFLRGTVENCDFPLTGYAPMDEVAWTRVFKICKAYGLNHMRFHSYCPPEAAFIAADKAGIYLQIEGPSWCNHGTSLGDGKPIDKYLYEETERILKTYGNHSSFCMMAYGNEPRGRYVEWLNKWVVYFKAKDPRHLYTGASTGGSWSIIPNSEYLVRAKPRGLGWNNKPQTLFDFADKLENQKVPYLSHEVGQYCVFPNFAEIKKYTGPLKALNFELFQEDLADQGMGDQAHDFMMASGKLQVLCYKAEIEAALRTPGFAGFQLLSLNDYSGQGTALVGLLDVFWDEKGYVAAPEFTQFCNTVVPLARIPKFVFTNNETFNSNIEIANFSGSPLQNVIPEWKITDDQNKVIAKGSFKNTTIPVGNCFVLGTIHQSLAGLNKASKLSLHVSVGNYHNNWNFWVYPSALPLLQTRIYTCEQLDSTAISILDKGGKVFLQPGNKLESGKEVIQYFTPVFWNTSWFKMKPPHTTGFLCNPTHPAFADFPTAYHSDLQWWEIVQNGRVMQLDSFPKSFRPILQPIDTWFLNRKLAMIFETKVGNGSLLVCSADLQTNLEDRPAAKQLRYSLLHYMESPKFNPQQSLSLSDIQSLFQKNSVKAFDARTKDSPDELKKNLK